MNMYFKYISKIWCFRGVFGKTHLLPHPTPPLKIPLPNLFWQVKLGVGQGKGKRLSLNTHALDIILANLDGHEGVSGEDMGARERGQFRLLLSMYLY